MRTNDEIGWNPKPDSERRGRNNHIIDRCDFRLPENRRNKDSRGNSIIRRENGWVRKSQSEVLILFAEGILSIEKNPFDHHHPERTYKMSEKLAVGVKLKENGSQHSFYRK